jgi:hypothetical protein
MLPIIRILCIIICILSIDLSSYAQISKQRTWNLSIGADVIYPENNFRKTHGWGYGTTIKTEYLFEKHISLIFSTGIYSLSGKINILNPKAQHVQGLPVKAGLRYYFGNFYIGGNAGWMYQFGFEANNGLVYSFFIGDELITNKRNKNSLDISFRHEAWVTDRTRAFAALRLAYEFRIK